MNTRIQELAEQAKNQVPKGILAPDLWIQEYNRIFAELIVWECCDLIMKNQYNMVPGFMERMSAYSEICMLKEHFGIE